MNKHTPGPWQVFKGNDRYPGIDAENKTTIVLFGSKNELTGIRGESAEESKANAHLIAAAPELLEVCEKLLAHAVGDTVEGDFLQDAEIAIAKAKGEEWACR